MVLPVLALLGVAGLPEFNPGEMPAVEQLVEAWSLGRPSLDETSIVCDNRTGGAHLR